ncbi:MFS transporter [Amycolatopsis echigonensis]|uniref:MFS transporter n=1 Tax=Amycolatopsis echigonensis TaxID=2576905 RepID=A0A8E2B6G9_9PSEU|nr:MFS transporter [Amycolatopsis echigonensis]
MNVGYASLTMRADIGLTAASYGLGAGIFFAAYCLLEVPSNLLLQRFGARAWIARIMITWGLVVILSAFVQNTGQFFVARVLLGAAEAGFYPGVVYFLTRWFPRVRLASALAVLTIAGPVGNIVVGPLSGWILQATHLAAGLQGWRWLFIIEGVPAIVAGVLFAVIMRDTPASAKWLTDEERRELQSAMVSPTRAQLDSAVSFRVRLASGLKNRRAWAVALLLGANYLGVYGVIFWLPTLVKGTGIDDTVTVGLLSAIPWCVAIVATLLVARSADRTQRHRALFAVGMFVAVVGLLVSVLGSGQTTVMIVGISIATAAFSAAGPLLWVIASPRIDGTAGAAVAFGLINAIASIGSFLGPYIIGLGTQLTGSARSATVAVSVVVAVGGGAVMLLRRDIPVAKSVGGGDPVRETSA